MIGPNAEDEEKYEAMKQMYETCKSALEIIRL